MGTVVERLGEILGGPDRRPVPVPWDRCASGPDGLRFPADYRWLVDTYGSISIRSDLRIWSPRLDNGGFEAFLAYTEDASGQAGPVHGTSRSAPTAARLPFDLFPAPGGLLAWGGDVRGNYLFWLTADPDPDRWPVVVWIQDLGHWDLFPGSAADFLVALLGGEYHLGRELLGDQARLWAFEADWSGLK
ncbi:SMI1/KNR4 family protein [Kitasatospora sp. NPDC058965]|uniref:SMI1/KNR4 family protein n=1 Tax=Kitasatospora sp. NPDC058965 TaxID=3346682 RepID=UPI003690C113